MARRKKSIHGQARINEITVIKMKQASHAVKTFMNAYKWGLNLERRERGEKKATSARRTCGVEIKAPFSLSL